MIRSRSRNQILNLHETFLLPNGKIDFPLIKILSNKFQENQHLNKTPRRILVKAFLFVIFKTLFSFISLSTKSLLKRVC